MRSIITTIITGTVALLALGACTVNEPPVAAAPAPVVVQTPQPAPGTVVVQPQRGY